MKALTSPSPKIFEGNYTGRAYLSARTLSNDVAQIRFFRAQKLVNLDCLLSFPLQIKAVESLTSSCFSSDAQASGASADEQPQPSESKMVHVKFQLRKECLFGQKFLLVGDDPIFGLWDPLDAIPLDWSDGHVWAVELDLPVGKAVHFKFILERTTGDFVWQPGVDRLLEAWETNNTIIVSEDWENADFRMVTEEPTMYPITGPDLPYPNVEVVDNVNEGLIVAENISCPKDENLVDNVNEELIVAENISCLKDENLVDNVNGGLIVAENISCLKDENLVDNVNEGLIVAENISCPKDENLLVGGSSELIASEYTNQKEDSVVTVDNTSLMECMVDSEKELQTAEEVNPSQQEIISGAEKALIIGQSIPQTNGPVKILKDEDQGIHEGGAVLVPGLISSPTIITQDIFPQKVEKVNNISAPVQSGEADDNRAIELPQKQEPHEDTCQGNESVMMISNWEEAELHIGYKNQLPQKQEPDEDTCQEDRSLMMMSNEEVKLQDSYKNQLPQKQEPDEDTCQEDKSVMMMSNQEVDLHVDGAEKSQTTKEQEQSCVRSAENEDDEEDGSDILQSDIQWGRQALLKFLSSLGFE